MTYNQLHILRICQRYKLRVIRISKQPNYYLIATNRGTKELREWDEPEVMRWSFAWREHLARQGYRNVVRFIRTRDGRPYVIVNNKGYSLTDHLPQAEKPWKTMDQVNQLGRMTAEMHRVLSQKPYPSQTHLLTTALQHIRNQLTRATTSQLALLQAAAEGQPQDPWLNKQFRPLLQRMKLSEKLLSEAAQRGEPVFATHRYLGRENWVVLDEVPLLHGLFDPEISIQYSDIASLLRDIYLDTKEAAWIEAFLTGYESVRPLRQQDYQLLIGFLAFPEKVWKQLEQYLADPQQRSDDALQSIKDSLQQQNDTDPLIHYLAARQGQRQGGERNSEQTS